MSDILRPDAGVIYDALSMWYKDAYHGQIEIGWRDPASGILNRFKRFELDEIEELATFVHDTNSQEGANVYFRPSTVRPSNGPATDSDVWMMPGVWADCDDKAAVDNLAANPLRYRPTFMVITGRDPEVRGQAFWQFSEPVMTANDVRDINSFIAQHFGSDPAVVNVSRLMRIPGSVAWPVKKGRTKAEITEWLLPADAAQRRTPASAWAHMVRQAAPKAPEITPRNPVEIPQNHADQRETGGFSIDTGRQGVSVADLYRDVRLPGSWHHSVLRLVASWVNRGFSDLEIKMMAPALTLPGFTVRQTVEEVEVMIKGAREKWGIADKNPLADAAEKPPQTIWVDRRIDFADLPVRPWLAHGFLMRSAVSVLSGQGAGGKSSMVIAMALAAAAGIKFGAFVPGRKLKIGIFNVEDDQDEQARRCLAALAAQPDVPQSALSNVLRMGPDTVGTLFERDPDTGEVQPTAAMKQLEQIIQDEGLDVLFVDPLAELHNADENDNTAMRSIIAAFRATAQRLNICICILHHDRKGVGIAGDVDRMRGASSLSGAARVVLTLTRMTEEEASALAVDPQDRKSYIRIDNAKSNYSLGGEAGWYKLDGYTIPNGEQVAAATPWTPPKPLDGITRHHVLMVLEAAMTEPPELRRKDMRAEGWLGHAAMAATGLPEAKVKIVIGALIRSGALYIEMAKDSKRMPKAILTVDEKKYLEIKTGERDALDAEAEDDE